MRPVLISFFRENSAGNTLIDAEPRHLDPLATCNRLVALGLFPALAVEHAFGGRDDHLRTIIFGRQCLANGFAHPGDIIGPVDLPDPLDPRPLQRLGDRVVGRLGLVLRGLAGLEERPERNVVLPTRLTALLAPGPRSLARVDDGRAGLHLLVLSVGETRRLAIHTSNLKHVPRRRRRLPSQMRRPRPRDPLRAHRSRAETGARRSPAYRRGYVR